MSAITMCKGINCPYTINCFRYTATPTENQDYFEKSPIKNGVCKFYWGINSKSLWDQLTDIFKFNDNTTKTNNLK